MGGGSVDDVDDYFDYGDNHGDNCAVLI